MKLSSDKVQSLLAETKTALERIYQDRLCGVYLYGSYARGEQDAHSDLDLLIVLDGIERYTAEVDRTSLLVSDLSPKYGISISRVFVSEAEWTRGKSGFLANAREEAIPA